MIAIDAARATNRLGGLILLRGDRFERWTVIGTEARYGHGLKVRCRCDCGTERLVSCAGLKQGKSKSCGCRRITIDLSPTTCNICGFTARGPRAHTLHRAACVSRINTEPRMTNRYEVRGDITVIFIRKQDGSELEAMIDTADLPKASSIRGRWHPAYDKRHGVTYVAHGTPKPFRVTILLHRFITDAPRGTEVDHWDHDGLNNRRENLRVVDVSTNQLNRLGPSSRSTTGVLGVTFSATVGKFQAAIRIQKKQVYLGTFETKEDAAAALRQLRMERGLPTC